MAAHWEVIILTALNGVSSIVGSAANLLIIVSSLLNHAEEGATELFLINLSATNLLICAIYQPILVWFINDAAKSNTVFSLMAYVGTGLTTAFLNGLLVITLDRFVSIYLPFKYVYWMTERNSGRIILVSWILSVLMVIVSRITFFASRVIVNGYIATVLVMVSLFYSVIPTATEKQGNIPVAIFPLGAVILRMAIEDISRILYWCFTAASFNSCIDPFVYYWQFSKFRRAIRKSLRSLRQKIGLIPAVPCAGRQIVVA